MITDVGFERCLSFINCQLRQAGGPASDSLRGSLRPAVTISRETGSGAHSVAEQLAAYLQKSEPRGSCGWAVFDRNLVERVLEDHHLPGRLSAFMPEDRVSAIDDALGEVLGLHPATWTLVRQTAETILRLAKLGKVILVGRGANIITASLPNTFHVRLVGSLERRVAHLQEIRGLSPKAALELVQKEDRARRRYLRQYFKQDIGDCRLYDLVINTDRVPYDEAARIIGEAVCRRFPQSEEARSPRARQVRQ